MLDRTSGKSLSLMTFAEVQTYLGIKSRKTLLRYIRSGQLAAFKIGGTRWRLSQAGVDEFIRANSVMGAALPYGGEKLGDKVRGKADDNHK